MSENIKKPLLIEPQYWPPVAWMKHVSGYDEIVLDTASHFVKGSFRNRAQVLGPNGVLQLSVPLSRVGEQRPTMGTISINYEEDWRKNHWMTLMSCYRRSPYYEFLEDLIAPIYVQKFDTLMELNTAILRVVFKLLKSDISIKTTDNYIPTGTLDYDDYRDRIVPSNKNPLNLTFKPYIQVFSDRFPFTENLSIIDTIFNQGKINLNDI